MPSYAPFYNYGITPGSSIANPRQVESLVRFPPTVNPDQAVPSVNPILQLTLDQTAQFNGTIVHVWYWPAMSHTDFNTLMQWIFGGYTTGSIAVSIKTRNDQNAFATYNCTAIRPLIGQDYTRTIFSHYRDLRLTFRNLISY